MAAAGFTCGAENTLSFGGPRAFFTAAALAAVTAFLALGFREPSVLTLGFEEASLLALRAALVRSFGARGFFCGYFLAVCIVRAILMTDQAARGRGVCCSQNTMRDLSVLEHYTSLHSQFDLHRAHRDSDHLDIVDRYQSGVDQRDT